VSARSMKTKIRRTGRLKLAIGLAVASIAWAGSAIAQKADRYAKEEAAIRSEAESFVQAFNNGEA
jgi:hypothetical protein